jgi:hypothetical protein
MNRKAGLVFLMIVVCGALMGCGSVDDAVPVAFGDACAEDDRWVSVEGLLALGEQTSCETVGDMEQCHIVLANPDNPNDQITVTIEVEDANNRMNAIPDSYTDADLVVRDNAGTTVGAGDLVRVIGTASNDEAGFACRIWVRQIEAVP